MRGKFGFRNLLSILGMAVVALAPIAFADPSTMTEDDAIKVVTGNGDWQAKYDACTRLRQVGTAKSIPALAPLLTDAKLSHMARYALEHMPYPEVDSALRNALAKASGAEKTGIIISIGARRDPKAVPALAKALTDNNVDLARAAAGALGRIGTPDAAKAMLKYQKTAPYAIQPALADGLLAAGDQLAKDKKIKEAIAAYDGLLNSSWPIEFRMGAFRGLTLADPAKTSERLIAALGGNEALFRDMAAQLVADTKGADATAAYAAALPKLSPEGQAALLRGLQGRKDGGARAAVLEAVKSNDNTVKIAAIHALATVGSPDDVSVLAGMLDSGNNETVEAAKGALGDMECKGADAAIASAAKSAGPFARARLIEVLSERMAPDATQMAEAGLGGESGPLRMTALRVLAKLGTKDQAPAVIAVLKSATDAGQRDEAAATLGAIGSAEGEAVLPAITDALKDANPDARIALLGTLGRIGGAKAIEPVVAALGDSNATISDAAARVLSNWPTADAAPALLKLAQSKDAAKKDLGLRGFVRLAQAEPNADTKVKMLGEIMKVAKRPEDKWPIIAAWGTLQTKQSLDTLTALLKDSAVQKEASTAIISIAAEMGKKPEGKADAVAALQAVVKQCKDDSIRDRAQKMLAGIGG